MSLVYHCASANQIYLGEDEKDVANKTISFLEAASSKLERVVRDLPYEDGHLQYKWKHFCTVPDAWIACTPISNEEIIELSDLYLLPWFR